MEARRRHDSTKESRTLESNHSLEVRLGERVIFSSSGRWLHPLLELGEFLRENPQLDRSRLITVDKIVGRAAALLMIRLGLKTIHAEILSRLALEVFTTETVSYNLLVDAIACQTEELLKDTKNPEEAYQLVSERALKSHSSDGSA